MWLHAYEAGPRGLEKSVAEPNLFANRLEPFKSSRNLARGEGPRAAEPRSLRVAERLHQAGGSRGAGVPSSAWATGSG